MDIYPWFNSKNMATYLQKAGRMLDAAEMAYIVYQNEAATLGQKVAAWEEIVETEPDCELRKYSNTDCWASTHEFLSRLVEVQRKKLDLFEEPGGCLFCPRESRRTGNSAGIWPWAGADFAAFSSMEGCVRYLRQEYGSDDSDDAYDRFEIGKLRVDHPDEPEGWENVLTLNADFQAVSVEARGLSEEEKDIDILLSDWFLALPCPFNVGDVVIDTTVPGAAPFVFDRLKFWDSKEMAAHGVNFDSRRAEKLDAGIARQNERGSWDCSYMVAMGYQLAAESQNPISDHGCAYYDPYGACNNYLNLERYDDELQGERGLLAIISEHLKGKLGIEEFLNFSQAISLDAHARKLKDDFDRDYVEEAHGLYGGKTNGRHRSMEEASR